MKERPIIFNADMVRAILYERKMQTRREAKVFQYPDPAASVHLTANNDGWIGWWPKPVSSEKTAELYPSGGIPCPYGQPGDRLWVRETWAHVPATAYRCSEGVQQTINPGDPDMCAVYREGWERSKPAGWRPSIHMPRWASRITLEIKSINIERLQDISEDDAQAEGLRKFPHKGDFAYAWRENDNHGHGSARGAFMSLWQSIYGQESWDSNPWVWVIKFERIK